MAVISLLGEKEAIWMPPERGDSLVPYYQVNQLISNVLQIALRDSRKRILSPPMQIIPDEFVKLTSFRPNQHRSTAYPSRVSRRPGFQDRMEQPIELRIERWR